MRRDRFPVESVRPDPLAWAEALRLAGGDARRCRTVSASTVIVLNFPGQKLPPRPPEIAKLASAVSELTRAPEHTAERIAERAWLETAGHRKSKDI